MSDQSLRIARASALMAGNGLVVLKLIERVQPYQTFVTPDEGRAAIGLVALFGLACGFLSIVAKEEGNHPIKPPALQMLSAISFLFPICLLLFAFYSAPGS